MSFGTWGHSKQVCHSMAQRMDYKLGITRYSPEVLYKDLRHTIVAPLACNNG